MQANTRASMCSENGTPQHHDSSHAASAVRVVLIVGVPGTETNQAPLERGGPPGGPWVGAGTGIASTKRPPHFCVVSFVPAPATCPYSAAFVPYPRCTMHVHSVHICTPRHRYARCAIVCDVISVLVLLGVRGVSAEVRQAGMTREMV
jgi:hypothetical protein